MTAIVTAVYGSETTAINVVDHLVSTGIARKRAKTDEPGRRVSVASAETAQPEMNEILSRHQPIEIKTSHAR